MSANAFDCLMEAVEVFILGVLNDAKIMTKHANRHITRVCDFKVLSQILGRFFPALRDLFDSDYQKEIFPIDRGIGIERKKKGTSFHDCMKELSSNGMRRLFKLRQMKISYEVIFLLKKLYAGYTFTVLEKAVIICDYKKTATIQIGEIVQSLKHFNNTIYF